MTTRHTMPHLAWGHVWSEKAKSATAIAGITFVTVLALMQLGFLETVRLTASNPFDHLDFEVAILSKEYDSYYEAATFPRERLTQALNAPAVVSAAPLYVTINLWRCPPVRSADRALSSVFVRIGEWTGLIPERTTSRGPILRGLCVIGFDPSSNVFAEPTRSAVANALPLLRERGNVIMDSLSQPDFGWQDRDWFKRWNLRDKHVAIVGGYSMGTGFAADASIICSDETYCRSFPTQSLNDVNLGLVKVQPGRAAETANWLNSNLPVDVLALSREQLIERERRHWIRATATGVLFDFGVFVAILVGVVVVYQVLANDVTNHYAEYATLKAIGYSNLSVCGIVARQALLYAAISFPGAWAISWLLYRLVAELAHIPMDLTWDNLLFAFVATHLMCLVSALLTLSKALSADPADLY